MFFSFLVYQWCPGRFAIDKVFFVYGLLFYQCFCGILIVMVFLRLVFSGFYLPCISCGWVPILGFFIYMVFLLCGCDIGAQAPTSLRPLDSIALSNLHGDGHGPHRLTFVLRQLGHMLTCYSRMLGTSCGGKFRPIIAPRETLWCQFFQILHNGRIVDWRR